MALYADQVHAIVNRDYKAKRFFEGVFPSDQLPIVNRLPMGFIVNLDESHQDGSHWVAVWVLTNGKAMYFDSFGMPPLNASVYNMLSQYNWIYNKKKFQHATSDDCGYYAIFFILLASRNVPMDHIQILFKENKGLLNDILVKYYIKDFTVT